MQYLGAQRARAKNRGRVHSISPSDLLALLWMAGITIDDVGPRKHQYALARLGDTGDYVIGNVRFITNEENWKEYRETPQYERERKNGASAGGRAIAGKPRAGWTEERREKMRKLGKA